MTFILGGKRQIFNYFFYAFHHLWKFINVRSLKKNQNLLQIICLLLLFQWVSSWGKDQLEFKQIFKGEKMDCCHKILNYVIYIHEIRDWSLKSHMTVLHKEILSHSFNKKTMHSPLFLNKIIKILRLCIISTFWLC